MRIEGYGIVHTSRCLFTHVTPCNICHSSYVVTLCILLVYTQSLSVSTSGLTHTVLPPRRGEVCIYTLALINIFTWGSVNSCMLCSFWDIRICRVVHLHDYYRSFPSPCNLKWVKQHTHVCAFPLNSAHVRFESLNVDLHMTI